MIPCTVRHIVLVVTDCSHVVVEQGKLVQNELNPELPNKAYDHAVRQIVATSATQSLIANNRDNCAPIRDGIQVTFRNEKGERVRQRLRAIDFKNPDNNEFLCVRELWVRRDIYRRRADIVGFVNGLSLLFMELKNVSKDIRAAYSGNLKDYKDTVPHLFHHNAIVILANGVDAKLCSVTSRFGHFHEWIRLAEDEAGALDMGGNHQYLGVNRAIDAVRDRGNRAGRLGVFRHTQGAGKSYSMVMVQAVSEEDLSTQPVQPWRPTRTPPALWLPQLQPPERVCL